MYIYRDRFCSSGEKQSQVRTMKQKNAFENIYKSISEQLKKHFDEKKKKYKVF